MDEENTVQKELKRLKNLQKNNNSVVEPVIDEKEDDKVQQELLKRITTLKKNDGSIVYPRTVTDAIRDKHGRKLTDVINDLKEKVQEQTDNIAEVEDLLENKISAMLSGKVDKIEGKDLSTNDFTNELKSLLESSAEKVDVLEETVSGIESTVGNDLISKVENNDDRISFYSKGENVISELHFLNNDDLDSLLGSLDNENN